jgi:DUF4097 and DUF4098 domain-containing protein YvlB
MKTARLTGSRCVLAFAIVALSAPLAQAWDETEHVSRTIPFESGGTLRLTTFSGRVTITASDGHQVVVDAVRRASRDRLERIKLDIHSSGSTVYIDANHRERSWWLDQMRDNVVETDLDIKVPRRTDLHVTTFSAPVTVEGIEGLHWVHGFSSRLRLAGVTGRVQAHTFSGDVEIGVKDWRDRQSIDVDTFSGHIELRVPDEARGHVTFNSFSGHLNSDLPLTLHSSGRRNLSADLGNGSDGPSLHFKTFSGSVKILR